MLFPFWGHALYVVRLALGVPGPFPPCPALPVPIWSMRSFWQASPTSGFPLVSSPLWALPRSDPAPSHTPHFPLPRSPLPMLPPTLPRPPLSHSPCSPLPRFPLPCPPFSRHSLPPFSCLQLLPGCSTCLNGLALLAALHLFPRYYYSFTIIKYLLPYLNNKITKF